jgi:hypothetical protein
MSQCMAPYGVGQIPYFGNQVIKSIAEPVNRSQRRSMSSEVVPGATVALKFTV